MIKRMNVIACLACLVIVVAISLRLKAQQSATVPSSLPLPTFAPSWLAASSSPTLVTVTIALPYGSLIPGSVNLIELNAGGAPAILGQLHDDGQNGDVSAGDSIYSIRLPVTITTGESLMQFTVSAAFKGRVQRVSSPIIRMAAFQEQPPLPPDPGMAGMTTLEGVDSDHDGVRDDVERYIAQTYPTSAGVRSALTQDAKALQATILDASDPQLSRPDALAQEYADDCLSASIMKNNADVVGGQTVIEAGNALLAQVLNTADRTKAYFRADSQIGALVTFATPFPQKSSRCLVNPSTFPN